MNYLDWSNKVSSATINEYTLRESAQASRIQEWSLSPKLKSKGSGAVSQILPIMVEIRHPRGIWPTNFG